MASNELDSKALRAATGVMLAQMDVDQAARARSELVERDAAAIITAYRAALPAPAVPVATEPVAWRDLFFEVALRLGCLASSFADGNAHVLDKAARLAALLTAPTGREGGEHCAGCQNLHCSGIPAPRPTEEGNNGTR